MQGNGHCQLKLAQCYEHGRGVEQSYDEAHRLYKDTLSKFKERLGAAEEGLRRVEEIVNAGKANGDASGEV